MDFGGKVDGRDFHIFQQAPCQGSCFHLVRIGVGEVSTGASALELSVEMARLDNDAAESEHITSTFQALIDSVRGIAEVKHRGPVPERISRDRVGTSQVGLEIELNLSGDVKKTEKKVTWLANKGQTLIPGELWDFDYLLTKDKLEENDNLDDFLNPNTSSMEEAWCAETMSDVKSGDIIQLERKGYYRVDKGLNDWNGEEGEKGKRLVLFSIPTGKKD